MHLAEPHVVDDGGNEGGGTADACVIDGIIFNTDLPDGLKFLGLINGILRYGGRGANELGNGKRLPVLFCVGGIGGDDAPEVALCMGIVVARQEEKGG